MDNTSKSMYQSENNTTRLHTSHTSSPVRAIFFTLLFATLFTGFMFQSFQTPSSNNTKIAAASGSANGTIPIELTDILVMWEPFSYTHGTAMNTITLQSSSKGDFSTTPAQDTIINSADDIGLGDAMWSVTGSPEIRDGMAYVPVGSTAQLREKYFNKRKTLTRVSMDLHNEGEFIYKMNSGKGGVAVRYVNDTVLVRMGSLDSIGGTQSHTFVVSPTLTTTATHSISGTKLIHIDLYVVNQTAHIYIFDSLGISKAQYDTWTDTGNVFGDIDYKLVLGEFVGTTGKALNGRYDNIEMAYTAVSEPPVPTGASTQARTPVMITKSLNDAIEGLDYTGIVRADGGDGVLTYSISDGALPSGLNISSPSMAPGDDKTGAQYVGLINGSATTTGTYSFTVSVIDQSSQVATGTFEIEVIPNTISFTEAFTGTNGTRINNITGSQWISGNLSGPITVATYLNNTALVTPNYTLMPDQEFIHNGNRYMQAQVQIYSGTMDLLCGVNNIGTKISYDGQNTVRALSNYKDGGHHIRTDIFNVTPSTQGITVAVYMKGNTSRVYVFSDENDGIDGTQANVEEENQDFSSACTNGTSSFFRLEFGEGQYDNVIVRDVLEKPDFQNPVAVKTKELVPAYATVPFTDQLQVVDANFVHTWTANILPSWMSMSSDGTLTGTPPTANTYAISITVEDELGNQDHFNTPVIIRADPEPGMGTLIFGSDFDFQSGNTPSEKASVRAPFRWSGALSYRSGGIKNGAHNSGSMNTSMAFENPPYNPSSIADALEFNFTVSRGEVHFGPVNSGGGIDCKGVMLRYDGVQHVAIEWNTVDWSHGCGSRGSDTRRQDLLLATPKTHMGNKTIKVQLGFRGRFMAVRIDDGTDIHVRGPYEMPNMPEGSPIAMRFGGLLPYGSFQFTSYARYGNDTIDDFIVRRGVWRAGDPSTLRHKEQLGQLLFFDPILSGANERSCASCHKPELGFADGLPAEMGLNGAPLQRNTPGLANIALMNAFFWEGRVGDLKDVSIHPISSGLEMNQPMPALIAELRANARYNALFNRIWPSGVTQDNIGEALATYVETIMELNTAYDRNSYDPRKSAPRALSTSEDNGFVIFTDKDKAGCTLCHSLEPVTGSPDKTTGTYYDAKFKALGVPNILTATAEISRTLDGDVGHELVSGNPDDRYTFRVPSLRNLSDTGPYMHNGVFDTLEEVVDFYVEGGGSGLGVANVQNQSSEIRKLNLTDEEKADLVAFLKALSPNVSNFVDIPLSVPSGLVVGGTDATLSNPLGAIAGSVVLTDGVTPLGGIKVAAYQQGISNTWGFAGAAMTNLSGEYTITRVLSGTYRIFFMDPLGNHKSEYWNDSKTITGAATIDVMTSTVGSIDAQLALPAPPKAGVDGGATSWTDPETGEANITAWRASDFNIMREVTCADGETGPEPVTLLIGTETYTMTRQSPGADIFTYNLRIGDASAPDANFSNPGKHELKVNKTCNGAASEEVVGEMFVKLASGAEASPMRRL
ncbi:MAG: cytochrome c peroxidase [Chloroflexota bacterium]